MMKNLSIVLNLVLLAAVGYLYYYDFSGKKVKDVAAKIQNNPSGSINNAPRPPLAYVDLDSLNENFTYFSERKKELDKEMKAIEAEQENAYKRLQAESDNFLRKGGTVTDAEVQAFQGKLMEKKQEIDNRKQMLSQKLNEKSFTIMEDIQKQLKEFLEQYNKEKKFMYIFTTGTGMDYMVYKDSSLNITKDVIQGMNAKMKPAAKQ
jgi:outer membrane protein